MAIGTSKFEIKIISLSMGRSKKNITSTTKTKVRNLFDNLVQQKDLPIKNPNLKLKESDDDTKIESSQPVGLDDDFAPLDSSAVPNEEWIDKIRNFHVFAPKNLTRKFIEKNFVRLQKFYFDKINCEDSSDFVCSNRQGIHYDFDVGADDVMFMRVYVCPKVKKGVEDAKFRDNYVICDFCKKDAYFRLRLNPTYIDYNHHPSRKTLINSLKKVISGESRKGFYIYGEPGVGKTHIMIAACNELAIKGKRIAYVYVPLMIQNLRVHFKNSDYESTLIERLKNADVCVLDDIGAETLSTARWFYSSFLIPILNWRMEAEMMTFFISNYSESELASRLMSKPYANGQQIMDKVSVKRIFSRILSLSGEKPIEILGRELRHQ